MEYGIELLSLSVVMVILIAIIGYLLEWRENLMDERLYTLYNTDSEFKDYVDRYCKKHDINMFEAFDHKMVRIFAKERMAK